MKYVLAAALLLAACRPAIPAKKLAFVTAGPGDVAAFVRLQRQSAVAANKRVVVYVGASWCEPCRRFHAAAAAGTLDHKLPSLLFVEFDLDHDKERLEAAGYTSQYIPLFAAPLADGRSSGKQVAGAPTNADAVDAITPRLLQLLAETRDL